METHVVVNEDELLIQWYGKGGPPKIIFSADDDGKFSYAALVLSPEGNRYQPGLGETQGEVLKNLFAELRRQT